MAVPLRVLILEDRPSDAELMLHALRGAGYQPEGQVVDSEPDYVSRLRPELDIILADYTLPQFNALRALRILQEHGLDVPLIVVTGSVSEDAAVVAVKEGAADYLLKDRLARLGPAVQNALEQTKIRKEKRAAEAALRESEQLYRALFETAPMGLALLDSDFGFLAVNSAFLQQGGFRFTTHLRGHTFLELISDPQVRQSVFEASHPESVRGRELRITRADGATFEALVSLAPIGLGGRQRWQATVQDITERKRAEAALRESEERFRVAVKTSPLIVSRLDRELRYTWIHNPSVTFDPETVLGKTDIDLVPMEEASILMDIKGRVLATGKSERAEVRVTSGASTANYDLTVEPLRSVNGSIVGLTCAAVDITARKAAAEELRRRASQLELLNSIVYAASTEPDLAGLVKTALNRLLDGLGLDLGLISIEDAFFARGLPPNTDLPSDEVRRMMATIVDGPSDVDCWDGLKGEGVPEPMLAAGAKIGLRSAMAVKVGVPPGNTVGGIAVGSSQPRSWTDEEKRLLETIGRQLGSAALRLRLMQQSQRQAKLMQRILDTVQEGIATLDAQHRVLNANPVARQFLNLLAEKDAAGAILSLGDRPLIELLRPRADGLPHELKLAGPPGRTFECQVNEARQEVGEREHTILIRDVTDQRKIEDRMERQERLAAVGQLAAGIAHDFNNIMAAIILHSEMLLTEPGLSAKGLTRQGTILEQARRAASLTQQVLDFSRQAIMETKPLDLLAFMLETMKLLQRTLPESIRVRLDFEKGPYFLRGDPTRVQQVLMNLALNARDAMPEGGQLRFEMSHLFLDAQSRPPFGGMELGNWLIVEVTDTGTGIPPDVLPHIFEPFFTTKPQGRGTGLGLSQVFGIVKQHGGYIDVSSRVGLGTSFVIYLPALEVVAEQGSVKEVEAPRGQGEGVLVVEDNEATRQAICDILASLNYRVLQARNGEEALAAFEGQSDAIDLVISDLVMPEMGGRALHGALKQKRPDLKLILMTGYPLGGETRELLQEQAVVWVQKPIGTQKLAEIVRRTLDAT